jgi:hypothetical protein
MKLKTLAKSRTVWAGAIGGVLNLLALAGVTMVAGMPVEELAENKAVLASQVTVIAAGICDLLAILFRVKAKVDFKED